MREMFVDCQDLIKIYSDEERNIQIPALRGCDFVVEKGEIISIVGPSGAGKTTLINILAGLETISSGQAVVAEIALQKLREEELNNYRLQKIGLVDQFPERTLFLNATVLDNMHFSYTLTHGDAPTTGERNRKIMTKLGIDHLETRIVRTLSGGEMTRVAIACSIAKNAPLLLCDEPTGQLDSKNTERVKELLKEITREYKTTIIVVTHDVRFLEGVDKTYEIRDGRVSAVLTKEEREAQQKFPLSYKSHIDSTRSARIPDAIYDSLKLKEKVEYLVSEKSQVEILNPERVAPDKIELQEYKERRKKLLTKPLPKNYHKGFSTEIQLKTVNKIYYDVGGEIIALADIDLTIHHGEIIFIMGPSGSGKTTLIKAISGLEPITSGEIFIQDMIFSKLTDGEKAEFRRENIGVVSQQGNLHPYLTIEENFYLREIFSGKTINESITEKKRSETMRKFVINHRKGSFPLEISGGELQRAFLAVTWNHTPAIMILDEPTTNLDSSLAEEVLKQILFLKEQYDTTLIVATHDLGILSKGVRVIELNDGKIETDGIVTE